MAEGLSCFTAGRCERRRFGRASAVLPYRWNNAVLSDQENTFPPPFKMIYQARLFQEKRKPPC